MKTKESTETQKRSNKAPASEPVATNSVAIGMPDRRNSTAVQMRLTSAAHQTSQAHNQRETQVSVDASPAMEAQRRQLENAFGSPSQRRTADRFAGFGHGGQEALLQRKGDMDEEELLQGKFNTLQRVEEEEELLQGKFDSVQRQAGLEEEELLQGKSLATATASQLQADPSRSNATGMPDRLKAGIESLSGLDMSDVQVHRNSSKPAQLNALAYAQGGEIHLGPGQEHHLPHEVWHVVQQRQGRVRPTMELGGQPVNDDTSLEKEADEMGSKALRED